LDISDVTGATRQIFVGTPSALGEYDVGTLAPDEVRTFQVTATLPDTGVPPSATTGDNRYQGSRMTLGLGWTAAGVTGVVPTPTPTVTPTPTPTTTPVATATPRPKPTATPRPKPKPTPTPTATPTPTTPLSIADMLGLPPASRCVSKSKMKFKLKAP